MSVNRSRAPGCGRSLRTIIRMALGPRAQVQHAGDLGDPGTGPDLAFGVIGGRPRAGRDLHDGLLHHVGRGEPDRVREPPPWPGQPGQGLVRATAGIGADQHPAAQAGRQLAPGPGAPRRYSRRRYSASAKCLRLVADGSFSKSYSPRPKALSHVNDQAQQRSRERVRLTAARSSSSGVRPHSEDGFESGRGADRDASRHGSRSIERLPRAPGASAERRHQPDLDQHQPRVAARPQLGV